MNDWQPIETAPKDRTVIMAFYSSEWGMRRYRLCYWDKGDWGNVTEGWVDEFRQIRNVQPTHWMPLPPPPLTSS